MIPYTIDWAIGLTVAAIATGLFNHRAVATWATHHYQAIQARRTQHGRRAAR